ncbi:MAG: flagellar export protein FliJ [Cetobacterium sp.]
MDLFNFKLQKILDLKIKNEDEVKIRMKKLTVDKEEIEDKIKKLREKYDEYKNIKRNEELYIQKIKFNYLETVYKSIQYYSKELDEIDIKIQSLNIELTKCQQERKSIENLKEKEYLEFKENEKKRENEILNEFASNMFIKKANNIKDGEEIGNEYINK